MRERQALLDAVIDLQADRPRPARQCRADRDWARPRATPRSSTEAEAALTRTGRDWPRRKSLRRCWTARPTATTPSLKSTPAQAAPKAATGPSMLARMYVRWAEKQGYTVELQSESPKAKSAGIKSAAYKISGQNAYGWLKIRSRACTAWSASRPMTAPRGGTPRSVRSGSIRWSTTTSRSTCRTRTSASTPTGRPGAGGQHVNTTDSAVRITHLPTNIVVTSSHEVAAPEPRHRDEGAEVAALPAGTGQAQRRDQRGA